MKKIITYLIASTMLLSFTACNSENQNSSSSSLYYFSKEKQNTKEESSEINYTEEDLKNAVKSEVGKEPTAWFYDDFDLDNKNEAFAIYGEELDEINTIYFINNNCKASRVKHINGQNHYYSILETSDGYKFLNEKMSTGGSSGTGFLFGVKEEEFYEPRVSGDYFCFLNEDNKLTATVSTFGWNGKNKTPDGSGHYWIGCPMTFDKNTKEFSVDETKATPPDERVAGWDSRKYPHYVNSFNLKNLGECAFVCTYEGEYAFVASNLYIAESLDTIGILNANEKNNRIVFKRIISYDDNSCETHQIAETGYSPKVLTDIDFNMFDYSNNIFYGASEQFVIDSYQQNIGLVNLKPKFEITGTLNINRPLNLLPLDKIDWSTIKEKKASNGRNIITFKLKS